MAVANLPGFDINLLQELFISIKESFDSHSRSIRDVLEENRISLYDELKKHNLVYHLQDEDITYDNIRSQILSCFELSGNVEELELCCQHFLASLLQLNEENAIKLSKKLKLDWKRKAAKIDSRSFVSFLSKETLRKEETQLMEAWIRHDDALMMTHQQVPVRRQHSTSGQQSGRSQYPKEVNKENEQAKAFEEQFNSIVDIISREDIILDVACRLCEARVLPAATKDQAFKIRNLTIQVKCVIESVYTVIQRAVRPARLLENFIFVLNLPEFREMFSSVVDRFRKKSYLPNPTKNVRKHIKRPTKILPKDITSPFSHCDHDLSDSCASSVVSFTEQGRGLEGNLLPSSSCQPPANPDDYQNNLKKRYKHITFLGRHRQRDSWKYFDVSTNEKSVTKKSLQMQQSIEDSILDLACIPQDDPRLPSPRTLILGAPGIGKSSVVNELCRLWSEGHLLKAYQYVIRLRANDDKVRKAKTLKDLIPEKTYDFISQSYGRNCLFILDGYEDFFENEEIKENGFYDCLIRGEDDLPDELFEAALIVTARPWCAKQILKIAYFPREIEILGFTPDIRKQYVTHCLKSAAIGKADIECFLSQPPAMAQCTNNPFLLTTLLEIFIEYKQANGNVDMHDITAGLPVPAEQTWPKTLTSLYGFLIRLLVLKSVKKSKTILKHLPPAFSIPTGEFFEFPHLIYEHFLKVCSIAYQTISTRFLPLNFDHDDLVTFELINGPETIEYYDGQQVVYEFLHSSIREYLAAYFISRMDEREMEKRIKCLQASSFKYQLVIEFLYGFGCINKIDPKRYNDYKIVTNFNIPRQLCEAKHSHELIKSVYDKFSKRKETCIIRRTFPSPAPFDFWCLGRVIALSGCEWELGFTLRPIRDEHIKSLREGFDSVNAPSGVISKLGFSLTRITDEGVSQICQMNEANVLHHVTQIHLNGNYFTSSVISTPAPLYSSIKRGIFRNLSKLLFHYNSNIKPGQQHDLIVALKDHCRCLKHVAFTDLAPDECRMLCSEVRQLRVIELWRVSIKCCQNSFESLANNRHVQQLEIHQSNIRTETAQILPHTLPHSAIKCLKLINCNINDATVRYIANAVEVSQPKVRSIDLSNNVLGDKGGRRLLALRDQCKCDLLSTYKFNSFFEMQNELKLTPEQQLSPAQLSHHGKGKFHQTSGGHRQHQNYHQRKKDFNHN